MRGIVLIGESMECADLYYASRFVKSDPFVFLEAGGRRIIAVDPSEVTRARSLSGADEVWDQDEFFSLEDASRAGVEEQMPAVLLGAVRRAGVTRAVVPDWFPVQYADLLRANAIEVEVDPVVIRSRRRTKTADEVAAIEQALRVAEQSMELIRRTLRATTAGDDGVLCVEGRMLTSEKLQDDVRAFWAAHRCEGEVPIIAGGGQAADGFETGHGPLRKQTPITCDLFPRHTATRYHADITRVFCVGEPPRELAEVHACVRRALELARSLVRPGVRGSAVYEAVCELYHAEGHATPLHDAGDTAAERTTAAPYLGHGLGLDVHELETGVEPYNIGALQEGDVITLEPELYRLGWGAVRLEDVVLVTTEGARTLTRFDYDLC